MQHTYHFRVFINPLHITCHRALMIVSKYDNICHKNITVVNKNNNENTFMAKILQNHCNYITLIRHYVYDRVSSVQYLQQVHDRQANTLSFMKIKTQNIAASKGNPYSTKWKMVYFFCFINNSSIFSSFNITFPC